ncbi:type IV pilus assembly protein PilB [Vibrio orientalis CIP 102891 = ATCC 33934]|uniref:Type 4 fimbrial assembly ATPase PilB n=1 Tax=Vibrio orientalis CIP 102891 = ATCC 33934 TaxID=675816 RepID=C9QCK3_VIBOR|nr:type IV-A pilus assembly ATPase PilB [Vibrio orientalis]EEX95344.1 type 4 fimbrial assembly ATPase PilB [Vibrio orientalis CIP 102891 = ATCC 33934]EGU52383.1 type IV pilus assembly protein PilB [Vibrio orientalis CIP 102891 = ATCC 33934]
MLTNLPSILRQAKLIDTTQENQLVEYVKASGVSVPEALLELDFIAHRELTKQLSRLFGLAEISLCQFNYQSLCHTLGLRELITRFSALPINQTPQLLTIAVADPTNLEIEDEFRFATGLQVELVLADVKQLHGAIRQVYGQAIAGETLVHDKEITEQELASLVQVSTEELSNIENLSTDEAPISRFINQVLLDAVRKRASDIHFEPYEHIYRIRLRCDGILVETQQPKQHLNRRLSARLKILAKLDITEKRLPQDGRIKLRLNSEIAIDMRVSTLPTLWGEKIVLRILDSSCASLNIDSLGYNAQQQALYLSALSKPQGMILMTGPTGSGKTTSLYTGLQILNTSEVNIASAEDPIEINLAGINQVQVQPQIGFDFAQALRAFLRQDPDVVMVGEIRDLETAEVAVKAAQTGHLVLSTLHTNSAAESVLRLRNMGIEPFNIASSLSLIIAQRLARKLCHHCKQQTALPGPIEQQLNLTAKSVIYQASKSGCSECNKGYSGRTGIYEVMAFDHCLAQAISEGANVEQIEMLARQQGMQTLKESGIEKLLGGITSYQELQRVLYI